MQPIRNSIRRQIFSIREISSAADEMDDVVRLDIGQPDMNTPETVRDTVGDRIKTADKIPYTNLYGLQELRDEIAAHESHKTALDEDGAMVSTGGTGALFCILDTLLGTGDTVVANDPAWSPYQMLVAATPGTYRQVSYFDSDGNVRASAIRDAITPDTKTIILNSPENPTGRVYTAEQVQQLGEIAEDEDLYIIADEVYDRLLYNDTAHASPAQSFPDRTVIVNSMSKNFAMTGWRIGWAASHNEELIQELGKVNRATTACPSYVAQQAAITALQQTQDYPETLVDAYRPRRDLVMERVNDLGWDTVTPDGAIYAFPDTGRDSWDFARTLLNEAGVAVVPGESAGTNSDTNIRICFGSADMDALEEGFDRIEAFIS